MKKRAEMRKLVLLGVFLTALHLSGMPARAALVSPTDLSTINLGTQIAYQGQTAWQTDFLTPDLTSQGGSPSQSIGTMTGTVWKSGDIYTYKWVVDPTAITPSVFSTQFHVYGFDPSLGTKAGWSYSDASAAGVAGDPGGAFYIIWTLHNQTAVTMEWLVKTSQRTAGFWGNGAPIAFFLQSTMAPELNWYNLAGSQVGASVNIAPDPLPTPEPTSLLLLLTSSLVGGGYWFRRRNSACSHGA